jgi:D-sedoheptulose 7-phosphate isomerase
MSFLTQNIEDLKAMLPQLQTLEPQVDVAAAAIAGSLLAGDKLLAAGNGGSAADASHLTTEFVCRYHMNRKPYAVLSLATHGGDLTAIGNDYAFDDIFSRQVEAFGAARATC